LERTALTGGAQGATWPGVRRINSKFAAEEAWTFGGVLSVARHMRYSEEVGGSAAKFR
jgi:hypothetical protein